MLELIGEAGLNAFRTGCDECIVWKRRDGGETCDVF